MKRTSKIFVTVDAAIFRDHYDFQYILLVQRKNPPFQNMWALPGGFVDEGEDLLKAAQRELKEETNIDVKNLQQIGAYGKPDRDPRQHTVSVAFWSVVDQNANGRAGDDAAMIEWFNIDELPKLAFDHDLIIKDATACLKKANV